MTWILMMNDMRMAHFEETKPVCQAATREEIDAFVESEKVAVYHDPKLGHAGFPGTWAKSFRKGGPLEWFNALGARVVEFNVESQVAGYRASIETQLRFVPPLDEFKKRIPAA